MSKTTEFFCRLPKSIDLIQDFQDITPEPKPDQECSSALYSSNGKYFAYTQPNEVVVIKTANKPEIYDRVEIPEVMKLHFSSQGSYLCFWCKPIMLNKESGVWNNNVKVYNTTTKKFIAEWSAKHQSGWEPQFTQDEKIFIKNFNNKEIHFFEINQDSTSEININQPTYKYKVDDPKIPFQNFQVSPGLNPSIAIFIPEKQSKPSQVLIYNVPNFQQPICSKSFFKAEKCQLKWNSIGTALLALSSTDHDTTNKSYYGESNLYLLGIAGSYDSRIDLKREGPIHDITWSPLAREFAVSYGFMPSETTFFDSRGNSIHHLPTAPRNTILYSPHARFVLVAGFGNLQGLVDVYDRQNKFSKVTTFEASNTSVCEWSPCGRFILTATTAPRLQVDNGLKIWHASGKLIYMKEYAKLYSISWKPQPLQAFPNLKTLEPAPEAHESTKEFTTKKEAAALAAASKPAGAYRPPHARRAGVAVGGGSLYEKELQNNLRQQSQPKLGVSSSGRPRVVPGAAPVEQSESKSAAKNRKKREAKKQQSENSNNSTPPPSNTNGVASTAEKTPEVAGVVGGVASLEEKKIRSLLKKLRAIESLKMKQASGEALEDTQVSKIKKEDEIRNELIALGWNE